MGVMNLLNFGRENIQGSPKAYGLYGGLHIAPFEQWDEKLDPVISGLAAMNLQKVAANHCTGLVAIENLYFGNGDEVVF
jgi:7,8-dihydropterin-6-yl-methyl-4-(beta-D-ribofuranosyl)aminobenzene 5'-phosphate synthase